MKRATKGKTEEQTDKEDRKRKQGNGIERGAYSRTPPKRQTDGRKEIQTRQGEKRIQRSENETEMSNLH